MIKFLGEYKLKEIRHYKAYKDLNEDWYKDSIEFVLENNIMVGYSIKYI